ncbi:hypothetical protein [Streptomyces chromofuscus]|uniref:Uncharacterized protein n=1 Tax=Streptomyces chromofuscus TaxID=42881 RepID=A0A7M2TAD7_STRCW|nr:hypothetical protein [Streptomyces chromofuscus]QOV44915.1 hypothetical protein IPT68_02600 [Streptomyces chromofuscus]GGT36810.1 hypothetical protein GCM10010254_66330 [Streptomyces chromofuscus]
MDTAGRDARGTLVALWRAAERLRAMAYDVFLAHQPAVAWSEFAPCGATPGMQAVGVVVDLRDGREIFLDLTVSPADEAFFVEADIGLYGLDDEENGGYRCLLEIPDARADSLDDLVATIEDRVGRLIEAGPDAVRGVGAFSRDAFRVFGQGRTGTGRAAPRVGSVPVWTGCAGPTAAGRCWLG